MKRHTIRWGILVLLVLAGVFMASAGRSAEPALFSPFDLSAPILEDFDPDGKITIALHDAKISDLVATLGVLANLPVYVDPDVQGKISIELHDVPFEKVLKMVSGKSGVWVRVENGKLVASRSSESLLPAATLPDAFHGAPRILVSEYDKVKSGARPVYATIVTSSAKSCYHFEVREQEPPTFSGQLGAEPESPAFFLTQFAYEPLSRVRYFVLEYGAASAALALPPGKPAAYLDKNFPGGLKVVLSETAQEGCQDAASVRAATSSPRDLLFEVRAPGSDGGDQTVMRPRVALAAGSSFGVSEEISDERTGQHRQMVVRGYLTRDGRAVAVLLTANAIWIDPADGREYYFVQPEKAVLDLPMIALTSRGASAGVLEAGVATPRPLEVKVFSGGEHRQERD